MGTAVLNWLLMLHLQSSASQGTGGPIQPAELLSPSSRNLVTGTLLALLVILMVIAPFVERARGAIGRFVAGPQIDDHNSSDHAHEDIRKALVVLSGTVLSIQTQIENNERVRRQSIDDLRSQLSMAIDLLEKRS